MARTWTFQSSEPDKRGPYTVTAGDDNVLGCDCPGSTAPRGCWHLRTIANALERERQACPDCGGPVFYDGTAIKFIPGARSDGRDWLQPCSLVACSNCEWAQEV